MTISFVSRVLSQVGLSYLSLAYTSGFGAGRIDGTFDFGHSAPATFVDENMEFGRRGLGEGVLFAYETHHSWQLAIIRGRLGSRGFRTVPV